VGTGASGTFSQELVIVVDSVKTVGATTGVIDQSHFLWGGLYKAAASALPGLPLTVDAAIGRIPARARRSPVPRGRAGLFSTSNRLSHRAVAIRSDRSSPLMPAERSIRVTGPSSSSKPSMVQREWPPRIGSTTDRTLSLRRRPRHSRNRATPAAARSR